MPAFRRGRIGECQGQLQVPARPWGLDGPCLGVQARPAGMTAQFPPPRPYCISKPQPMSVWLMIPTTFSPRTTGSCFIRWAVMMAPALSTSSSGDTVITCVVMTSPTGTPVMPATDGYANRACEQEARRRKKHPQHLLCGNSFKVVTATAK